MAERAAVRSVSVVVPLRNEAAHVDDLVADIARQDFAGPIEVLVADGESTDGSAERLHAAARRHRVDLRVLPNPGLTVPHGLNRCLDVAGGDLVVRLDAHSRYPADYVRRCVAASEETGADNVGGTYVAEGRTRYERAVACALGSPFGGVNWTRDVRRGERVAADTVYCGAFRRDVFERFGRFDERFVRSQDDELNLRIRAAGGTIVLDPTISSRYRPRGSWRSVFRQYHEYGLWKVAVMRKHRRATGLRSLAPAAFVASLLVLGAASVASRRARAAMLAEVAVYGSASLVSSAAATRRCAEPRPSLPAVASAFAAFHLGYGSGMLRGIVNAARDAGSRVRARGRSGRGRAGSSTRRPPA